VTVSPSDLTTQATPGPWQITQKRRAGTSGQLLSLAEIPYYVHANGSPVAGVWSRADAEFIAQARETWPPLLREVEELRKNLAERNAECADLRRIIGQAKAELERLHLHDAALVCALVRILGIHSRSNDWAIPWGEIQATVEAVGIEDWRDWTKW